jgi:hypothetical protein
MALIRPARRSGPTAVAAISVGADRRADRKFFKINEVSQKDVNGRDKVYQKWLF